MFSRVFMLLLWLDLNSKMESFDDIPDNANCSIIFKHWNGFRWGLIKINLITLSKFYKQFFLIIKIFLLLFVKTVIYKN